jgi:16S rRNA (guanine527-N7)-methyltransferase
LSVDGARTRDLTAGVLSVAEAFAQNVSDEAAGRVAAFVELLLRWNARINLTGARTPDELLREHLPDSFALAALVPAGASMVDVGSGGGLPAVPFALLRPDVSLTLVEPRAKRVAFLRTAIRELGAAAKLVGDRMEVVPGPFQAVTSRATFAPRDWLREGARLGGEGSELLFLVHDVAELPFPSAAEHRLLHYKAGPQERVLAALKLPLGA